MARRIVFTNNGFWKYSWAHLVMSMTESYRWVMQSEGPKTMGIQQRSSALSLTQRDFSSFSESFDDVMHCRWWDLQSLCNLTLRNVVFKVFHNLFMHFHTLESLCPSLLLRDSASLMAHFHWAVQFDTVRYGMQLCPFPLSEVVNGTKIANRTVPLFLVPFRWGTKHSKGYQKGGAKLTAEVDWLNRIVTFAWYKGIKLLHSFRSAVFGLLHQSAQTQKNTTVYCIILYFHTENSRFSICVLVRSCELVKRHCPKTRVIFKILLLFCHEM